MGNSKRNPLFDYLRSLCMAFVFLHHFYLSVIPGNTDYLKYLNPFAEFFVGISGFMVGLVYLQRKSDFHLIKRGLKILFAYYIAALPIQIVISMTGSAKSSLINSILDVLFFQEVSNWVQILIFYGIIFILLPVILPLYRKSKGSTILFTSMALFFITTITCQYIDFRNYFIENTVVKLLQWQMFFIMGLRLGDLYKNNKLNHKKYIPYIATAGIISFFVQILWLHPKNLVVSPYSFEKLLNTAYLAPLYLWLLISTYNYIKGSKFEELIRVLGKNSLVAFILSEFIRFFLYGSFVYLNIKISEFQSFVFSLLFSAILVWIIKIYDDFKVSKDYRKNTTKVA